MDITIGDWYTIKKPSALRLDSTYKYIKIHMKERRLWVAKCFKMNKVDWMSYSENELLYSIKNENIVLSGPSEKLDATILENKLR